MKTSLVKKTEKEKVKMSIPVVEKIADMVKSLSELCKKVVDAGDPEKYARSVESLNHGVNSTYEQMRSIIVNSEKFTEEEKLERLEALAKREEESKKICDEAIKGNREQVSKVVLEVTKGLLTCGIAYVPGIANKWKPFGKKNRKAISSGAELQALPEETEEILEIVD